jgi:glycosyltransferase involved in cell wall biosynthesis
MVAHNTLEMVKMSTLRTLRHSPCGEARLIVVDNGSSDGTETWLRMLAQRGDIDLIRLPRNIGHGPALERARPVIRSPFIVTLDSDAFPLQDDWLQSLRSRISGRVKATGILHHRDYIHPSCLMIERVTMDTLRLTFLNEKDKPTRLDVGERITHEIRRRGFEIAGLRRSGEIHRGSASEPVYLGSEYEELVHHQWYTTRSALATGGPVDDVKATDIEKSLLKVLNRYHAEPRGVTVIMGIRASSHEPQRLRNARACLMALNLQDLQRWRYRIIVVEQDSEPRCQHELAPLADRYLFAYNAGAYNRGWAFNIGAVQPDNNSGVLCLIDADLLVPSDFLARGLESYCTAGHQVVSPYHEIAFLDNDMSAKAIRHRLSDPSGSFDAGEYPAQVSGDSQGGCIWIDAKLYRKIGGHDERFRGWGREDREIWSRLAREINIKRLRGRLIHLVHPPVLPDQQLMEANKQLALRLESNPSEARGHAIGNPMLYSHESSA